MNQIVSVLGFGVITVIGVMCLARVPHLIRSRKANGQAAEAGPGRSSPMDTSDPGYSGAVLLPSSMITTPDAGCASSVDGGAGDCGGGGD